MNRKNLSAGQRFKILKRDNFTCQYCGAKGPDVELQIDHITPVCLGGTNKDYNLVTACKSCNLGKSGDAFQLRAGSHLGTKILNSYGVDFSPAWYFMSITVGDILKDYGGDVNA